MGGLNKVERQLGGWTEMIVSRDFGQIGGGMEIAEVRNLELGASSIET